MKAMPPLAQFVLAFFKLFQRYLDEYADEVADRAAERTADALRDLHDDRLELPPWMETFLDHLSHTELNVAKAARLSGISRSTAYRYLERCPELRRRWKEIESQTESPE